jgi:MFS family permease
VRRSTNQANLLMSADQHCQWATSPAKTTYFLFFLAQAFHSPWLPVFWTSEAGLSPLDIAWLNAAQPVVAFVAAPAMGYVADRTGHHKAIQAAGWVLFAASIVALPYVLEFWPLLALCCFRALASASIMPLVNHSVIDLLGPAGKEGFGQQRMYGAVTWVRLSFSLPLSLSLSLPLRLSFSLCLP